MRHGERENRRRGEWKKACHALERRKRETSKRGRDISDFLSDINFNPRIGPPGLLAGSRGESSQPYLSAGINEPTNGLRT
jgi:hypothetical protein